MVRLVILRVVQPIEGGAWQLAVEMIATRQLYRRSYSVLSYQTVLPTDWILCLDSVDVGIN